MKPWVGRFLSVVLILSIVRGAGAQSELKAVAGAVWARYRNEAPNTQTGLCVGMGVEDRFAKPYQNWFGGIDLLVVHRVLTLKDKTWPSGPRWDFSSAILAHFLQDDITYVDLATTLGYSALSSSEHRFAVRVFAGLGASFPVHRQSTWQWEDIFLTPEEKDTFQFDYERRTAEALEKYWFLTAHAGLGASIGRVGVQLRYVGTFTRLRFGGITFEDHVDTVEMLLTFGFR